MKKLILSATALMAAVGMAQAEDEIVIGSAIALSGFVAPYDEGPKNAALIAIDRLNKAGGVLGKKIKWVSADTKSDPAQGATAATAILSQGAKMLIVTCDFDFGAPAALVAQAKGIPTFSTCAADPKFGVQGIGDLAFTMSTGTPGQGALLAEFAYNKMGWRKPFVLTDTMIEYTRGLCGYFKDRWNELAGADSIVAEDTYHAINDTSIPSQITRIGNAKGADFLVFCGAINGGSILRQIRAGGVKLPILASESMDGDYWISAIPDLSDFYIAVYGSVFGNDPDATVKGLFDEYAKRYKRAVTGHALTGYSVVEAWAKAVERAGTFDGAAVRAELEKFNGEKLLVGPTTYTADLHINLQRSMLMMKVDKGKHTPIGRFTPEKVPAIRF